ncbi:MAG TPA: hypothetical protein VLA51_04560 [Paracoccaceae bacterium]|nr:hypothetical protein [Paracoccaceae bacterium]
MLESLTTVWIYTPTFWLIAGVILVGMELLDGSFIFFLPIGIASFGNATLNAVANLGVSPFSGMMSVWYFQLVTLAVMAVAVSYGLRLYSRKYGNDQGDINDY